MGEGHAGFVRLSFCLVAKFHWGWPSRTSQGPGNTYVLQLEDHEYKPLDPKDIRLPPPMPPSERLLAAVEAFYSPPSHDRPRNR